MFAFEEVFNLVKIGKVNEAKSIFKISGDIQDGEFIESIIALQDFIELFIKAKQPEATKHITNIERLLNYSSDVTFKIFIRNLLDFSEGISHLFMGNAVEAHRLLNIGSETIEKMTFFFPDFKKFALSYKAISYLALAKVYQNLGDFENVEIICGKVKSIQDDLLNLLDENNPIDIPGFAEVYATKLEIINIFTLYDMLLNDFENMKRRLSSVDEFYDNLIIYMNKLPDGDIKIVIKASLKLYEINKYFYSLLMKSIFNREPLDRKDIETINKIQSLLFELNELSIRANERGGGYRSTHRQLKRYLENFLKFGKANKKDFGRFGGLISFACFIVLLIIEYLILNLQEISLLIIITFNLILSLIVGFGYGALKFKPLIKIASGLTKKSK